MLLYFLLGIVYLGLFIALYDLLKINGIYNPFIHIKYIIVMVGVCKIKDYELEFSPQTLY